MNVPVLGVHEDEVEIFIGNTFVRYDPEKYDE